MTQESQTEMCDECGGPIYCGKGPPDGWQIDDGRNLCHACCVHDLTRVADAAKSIAGSQIIH